MKLYSIIGRLSYLILLYVQNIWGLPFKKPSQVKNTDLGGNQLIFDRTGSSFEQVKLVNSESLFSHVKRASDYSQVKPQQTDTDIYVQEVNNKGFTHTEIINNTKSHNTSKVYSTLKSALQSESTREFQDSVHHLRVFHKEVDLASAQGLHHKINEVVKFKTSKMVVTIASTLAALFSMSLLVAIFQCCCRKKQKRNSSSSETKGSKENKVATSENGIEDVNKKHNSQLENNHEETSDSAKEKLMDSTNDSEEDKVDIRSKIKAFEVKKDSQIHPSPEPVRHAKKRPGSEAFKAFESKGIIMGMGKAPKLQVSKESDEGENKTESTTVVEEIAEETQEEIDKIGKVADNPDVVIASDDEEDEFSDMKRETEVLKSYRKAAPPKGRNRSSRAFRLQQAEQSKSNIFDLGVPLSPTLEESNRNSEVISRLEEPQVTETSRDNSKKTEAVIVSTNNKTKEKSPSPPKETEEKSQVNTSGNIFLQIDPTAKQKSAVTPPVLRKKTDTESTGSRDSSGRKDKAKSSPLFLSNEKLMKDLEDKLKRQSSAKKKDSDDTSKEEKRSKETIQTAL